MALLAVAVAAAGQQRSASPPGTVFLVLDGPHASGLYHRGDCPSIASVAKSFMPLKEAAARHFQPHCLCLFGGHDGPPPCDSADQAPPPVALPSTGVVDRIIDGDTLVIAGLGSVRLIGVDTLEMTDTRPAVKAFAAEAAAFLRGLVGGKTVRIAYEGATKDRDGRTLAYLYLQDDTLVNREIIRQGYGHAYTDYPFALMDDFRQVQREAMLSSRGQYGVLTAVEPVAATVVTQPLPGQPKSAAQAPAAKQPAVAPAARTSPRCQATTKKGAQCLRNAKAGSNYCWQHGA
jgi:endonuclease YncB( thermonuclease family)